LRFEDREKSRRELLSFILILARVGFDEPLLLMGFSINTISSYIPPQVGQVTKILANVLATRYAMAGYQQVELFNTTQNNISTNSKQKAKQE
jgi:hypothetical protein